VTFIDREGVLGTVEYKDGQLIVKDPMVGGMVENWLDQGKDPALFVPHHLSYSNGYVMGVEPGSIDSS
jgi:hypothetical protein